MHELTNKREHSCTDFSNFIPEVQKTDSQPTEYDSEVEPWQESSFVGKGDLWFDANGERDAFVCSALEKRLGWHSGLDLCV